MTDAVTKGTFLFVTRSTVLSHVFHRLMQRIRPVDLFEISGEIQSVAVREVVQKRLLFVKAVLRCLCEVILETKLPSVLPDRL